MCLNSVRINSRHIHTSATLLPVFAQLCKAKLPHVDTFNIVDDSLVRAIGQKGGRPPDIAGAERRPS